MKCFFSLNPFCFLASQPKYARLSLLLGFCLLLNTGAFAQIQICVDKVPRQLQNINAQNGVFDFNTKWTNGSVLKVKFTGGTDFVRNKVTYYSRFWESCANISFQYIDSGTPDILISFNPDGTSWSYVGTNAKYYTQQGQPSMNFGWFNYNTTEEEFKRTTLHEFGHALGLLHEHMHPAATIHWNYPVVYNYYQAKGWSISDIRAQVLDKYSVTLSNHNYDKFSIMHYPIPREFTTDGYSVGWNRELSVEDKRLAAEMYPRPQPVTTTTGSVSCKLENIDCEYNVTNSNNQKGMKILLSFTINNAKNKNCRASAYFYYKDGDALKDFNNLYKTTDGKVASGSDFSPLYDNTSFTKLEIFLPYDELEMQDGEHKLKYKVSIWSEDRKELIQSGYYYFTYTKGLICEDFEVLANFNNNTMDIMPKFAVKNGQSVTCKACVYFYDNNEVPLKDANNNALSYCAAFRPGYKTTVYNHSSNSDLYMTIPYNDISIPNGTHNVKYFVALYDDTNKQFGTSKWYTKSFTRQ